MLACSQVISEIRRLRSDRPGPVVVALDGGSGAGKSRLASLIADKMEAAVIPVDDFFAADIPESQWSDFSTAEKLRYVFDWQRLREDVIKPLLAGKPARWYAFDFAAGLRPDGTYGMQPDPTVLEPKEVILLDGAYTAGPALSDLVDLAVLVDVPVAERHRRLAEREDKDFLARWHEIWDSLEEYYFTEVRPKATFDLVVEN
ncbi:MAG: hypothetical protein R3264_14670 [Anaerolineae bacterium]|nr:hypothetical protein [Anaerolineae bacterium]